jgi:hypothetical protein
MVSMHDAAAVGRLRCIGDLQRQLEQRLVPHRPAIDQPLQRLALEQLHDDE